MDRSFFSSLLSLLGVRHTASYSDARFASMPFRTLFGLSNLLKDYGVESEGIKLADKKDISHLTPPFILPVKHTYIIVTDMDGGEVKYQSLRTPEQAPMQKLLDAWDGTAFLMFPSPKACEPDYAAHKLAEVMKPIATYALGILALAALVWAMVAQGLFSRWYTILLVLFNMCGIWLSYMLVQKTVGVHTKAASRVCSVLAEGGCDEIAKSAASSFLGIFHWSEVGLTYFSVSLLIMLISPASIPLLGLINCCALPYTVWSISYQKFKAKTWCTMCVGVQITLWATFICYLLGGVLPAAFPLQWHYILVLMIYGIVMLAMNRLDAFMAAKNTQS